VQGVRQGGTAVMDAGDVLAQLMQVKVTSCCWSVRSLEEARATCKQRRGARAGKECDAVGVGDMACVLLVPRVPVCGYILSSSACVWLHTILECLYVATYYPRVPVCGYILSSSACMWLHTILECLCVVTYYPP